MNLGFWEKLHTPFFVLAPMADVTDAAFRRIVTGVGKPDVLWTEFVSADGLMSGGREVLLRDFLFTEGERPIVAQLFGSNVETMRGAAKLAAELGFDGVDINMGCPDRAIEKQGAGASMIKTPEIALQIIQAAKDGIADAGKEIPVSVKTRIGYSHNEIETWIPTLLAADIAALTVHCRTRKEMSKVPARWEHIKEVVEIRDRMGIKTKIIGNGDVGSMDDGLKKQIQTHCDGIMIGRAALGNPWMFDTKRKVIRKGLWNIPLIGKFLPRAWEKKILGDRRFSRSSVSVRERLETLVEHSKLFEELLGDIKSFAVMKKHFKAYVNGFSGAKELRMKLMETNNPNQVEVTIRDYLM